MGSDHYMLYGPRQRTRGSGSRQPLRAASAGGDLEVFAGDDHGVAQAVVADDAVHDGTRVPVSGDRPCDGPHRVAAVHHVGARRRARPGPAGERADAERRDEAEGLTSSSSVHAQLANLERRGLLRRDPTKPRAMELRGPSARGTSGVRVPLVGRISAGTPVLADDNVEDYLVVPSGFAGQGDHFALRVSGESMIGAGILDGDVVVVKRQEDADEGDVVGALLPGSGED